jgi:UDP-N-acetylmuramate--alanine ligase
VSAADASTAVPFDLSSPRRVHVVAVGGYAMSAIARYLTQLGHRVSGCDVTESAMLDKLRSEGIEVQLGHDVAHLDPRPDLLSVATAVRRDTPEIVRAVELGVTVLDRGTTMQLIAATKPKVAVVSGTHGKTSTTSMLTQVLHHAGSAPSFFVGGVLNDLGTNARYDPAGEWLLVEGDESDHSFLAFTRDLALVTNIEADHLDRWNDDFGELVAGFAEFVDGARLGAVLCIDDPQVAALAVTRPDALTYGYAEGARVRAVRYRSTASGSEIDVTIDGGPARTATLALRGRDMAQNALGALALATATGLDADAAIAGLESFTGVARRFQRRGTHNGADCFDDYAHTSTEVRTTLARAREGGWERVVAVFQPHRYTRIARHHAEFADAFVDADVVVVAGLDPAFEDPIPGVDASLVIDAVRARHPDAVVVSRPEWDDLADVPWTVGRPGDCIVTLGCGSITNVHDDWAREAANR